MQEPSGVNPITIQVPTPFSYKTDKAVPWKYEVEVHVHRDDGNSSKKVDIEQSSIENIVGIRGMTRSGRIYAPSNDPKEQPREKVKEDGDREKGKMKRSV